MNPNLWATLRDKSSLDAEFKMYINKSLVALHYLSIYLQFIYISRFCFLLLLKIFSVAYHNETFCQEGMSAS